MEKNIKMTVYLIRIARGCELILGKQAFHYLKENLAGCDGLTVTETDSIPTLASSKSGYSAYVYSDMPLVTARGLSDVAAEMEKRKLASVSLGRALVIKNGSTAQERLSASLKLSPEQFLSLGDEGAYPIIFERLKKSVILSHIKAGVIIPEIASVTIDHTVKIERGAVICPNNILRGATVVGAKSVIESGNIIDSASIAEHCTVTQSNLTECSVKNNSVIGPFSALRKGAAVGAYCTVTQSDLTGCTVGDHTTVGPFATLRTDAVIGSHCRIGDYVEIKKSSIGDHTKAAHLAYIGDAEIGEYTNVGCGTVFANYNGKIKQKTAVGNRVFIGANVNLVAPLTVGDNAFIAAGSTITENIPENAFAIARERQIVKENYY
ncbi:MAG: hypothetical protein LBT20_05705 [Clostridiales bacterium]|jgi:bifunctional N-acetylglucosamine-1-phosphate-uridyltransferase/glucosamine-1-phosphate-acetyltransferase GlmU-like protein|nr:hypothetical protein [Clostridiales bacterium]